MTSPSRQAMTAFDAEMAQTYDERFAALRAFQDAMHLLVRTEFSALAPDARILVAGAGTGAEVRKLAAACPDYRFALIDPSGPMLDIARSHAAAEGFARRCSFHVGYVEDVDETGFDAATSLLVSHFLTDTAARTAYFRSIAERLKPGAPLFVADLCADRSAAGFPRLMDVWLNLMTHAGMTPEGRAHYTAAFGHDFAVHGPDEVEAMMETAGFARPVQCLQTGLIRGWTVTKR